MDRCPDELVKDHLPLLRPAAQRLHARLPECVELGDLEQYGFFGLVDAARRFDPGRGIKFATFAAMRIRGAMLDGIRDEDWVPRLVRTRTRKVAGAFEELQATLGRRPDAGELATELGLTPGALEKLMPDATPRDVVSLSRKWFETDSHRDVCQIDLLADPDATRSMADYIDGEAFERIISQVPGSCRPVLRGYYVTGLTMREIGQQMGLCESRISQLHSQALAILKARIQMDENGNGQVITHTGRIGGGAVYTCEQFPGRTFTHAQAAEAAEVGTQYFYELLRQGKPAGDKKLIFRRVGEEERRGDAETERRGEEAEAPAEQAVRDGRRKRRAVASLSCDQLPGRLFTIPEAAAEAGVAFINSKSLNKGRGIGVRRLIFRRVGDAMPRQSPAGRTAPSRGKTSGTPVRGITPAELRQRLEARRDAEIAAINDRFSRLLNSLDLIADVLAEEAA